MWAMWMVGEAQRGGFTEPEGAEKQGHRENMDLNA